MTTSPRAAALAAIVSIGMLSSCAADPSSRMAADGASAQPTATAGAHPAGDRIYVTNENSGDLTIIDVASRQVVATVPIGKRPRGIRVSPDGRTLYVALSGSPIAPPGVDESTLPPPDRSADGIGVFDIREQRLVRVLPSGSDPEQLAVSRDGRRLFVANEDIGQVRVIDAADGAVIARIPVGGEPEGVDLRPDGQVVYVTSEEENEVFAIDADAATVIAHFAVGPRPRSTGFLPDGRRAYVGAENGASISVVDTESHRVVETIRLDGKNVRPMGIVAAPDGRHVFVTTGRGRTLVVIDTVTNAPVATLEVGERPWGVAVSPDGGIVVTANGPSNDVTFVDVAGRRVLARVRVGERPWGVAYVAAAPESVSVRASTPAGSTPQPATR